MQYIYIPTGSGEALLRHVVCFWIMYNIYRFIQCAPVFILCFQYDLQAMGRAHLQLTAPFSHPYNFCVALVFAIIYIEGDVLRAEFEGLGAVEATLMR
eukprot:COSAG05_NODE_401_length_10253_cov_23.087453_4_plen_98_part_00